jgi:hypothetical protein
MSIALVLIVVVVALNLLLTLALVTRVRALQAMVIGDGPDPLPAPGTAVGEFATTTASGALVTDRELRDATLVGFFSPDCDWCEKARAALLASPPALPMLAFVRGSEDDAKARALKSSLEGVARVGYTDGDDPVYRAFKPTGWPSLYLVKDGRIAAASHRLGDVVS